MTVDAITALFHPRRRARVTTVDRHVLDDGAALQAGDVFVIDTETGKSRRLLPGEYVPADIRAAADEIVRTQR